MKKRKALVSVLSFLLALLLIGSVLVSVMGSAQAVTRSEINALEEKKKSIAEQKSQLKSEIDSMKEEQATILEKKSALDAQNELTRQEIELINKQIELYDKLIEQKAAELEEAIAEEQAQMERYRTRMRAMEENGAMTYLAILFEAKSFSDLLARLDFISEIMEYDKRLEENLIAARKHVQEVKAEYEETQAEQEQARAELLEKKAQLEAEIEAAAQMIEDLEKDIEAYTAAFEENEAEEAKLQAEIDRLMEELRKQEEAAKQNPGGGGGGGAVYGTGSYIWPTNATYISSEYGYRIHPIFGTERFHAGIDIGANSGDPIYAADSGTVAVATYSSSYGYYVVINHGGGNSTLYAHMSSMAVSAGQSVSQGQVIGYVGSTGWSTGPHLHFETRSGGSTVDPLTYFSR
ncbi:MAG: murein hydrolase activator EnvC family protein [Oscillospiraceae bacterium]|jgi:murein DD-endopeptidase MepM/ murein hydrolase activator NlpD